MAPQSRVSGCTRMTLRSCSTGLFRKRKDTRANAGVHLQPDYSRETVDRWRAVVLIAVPIPAAVAITATVVMVVVDEVP